MEFFYRLVSCCFGIKTAWPFWGSAGITCGILSVISPNADFIWLIFFVMTAAGVCVSRETARRSLILASIFVVCFALGRMRAPADRLEAVSEELRLLEYGIVRGQAVILHVSPGRFRTSLAAEFSLRSASFERGFSDFLSCRRRNAAGIIVQTSVTADKFCEGDTVYCEGFLEPYEDGGRFWGKYNVKYRLKASLCEVVQTSPSLNLAERLRRKAAAVFLSRIPGPAGSFAAGLALGSSSFLTPEQRLLFRRAGLSHLTAASGFNISVIAISAAIIWKLFGMGRRRSVWAAVLAASAYAVLVGRAASIVRALCMGGIALAALPLGRPVCGLRFWGMAWIIMLAADPLWIKDAGFQLSFAALAGILLWGKIFAEMFGFMPRYAALAAAVGFSVSLGIIPLLIFHFGAVPSASVPAGLVVSPAAEGLFVMSWMSLFFCWLPVLSQIGFCLCRILAEFIIFCASLAAKFCPVFEAGPVSLTVIAAYYFLFVLGRVALESVRSRKKSSHNSDFDADFQEFQNLSL